MYLSALEVLQQQVPLDGDICEIGIHHGKSFFCFALGLPAEHRAVAIDVFDEHESNVDRSGSGDRDIFERHLRAFDAGRSVEILQSSSLRLAEIGFLDSGRRFRIFSIDGGHTAEITANDLRVAETTTVDGGMVVLDDVLNRHWLGVISGLFDYWAQGGTLVPAVLVPNKLILSTSTGHAGLYQQLMRRHFSNGLEKAGVPMAGHTVDVYGDHEWVVRDDAGGSGRVAKDRRQELSLRRRFARSAPGLTRHLLPLAARVKSIVGQGSGQR